MWIMCWYSQVYSIDENPRKIDPSQSFQSNTLKEGQMDDFPINLIVDNKHDEMSTYKLIHHFMKIRQGLLFLKETGEKKIKSH